MIFAISMLWFFEILHQWGILKSCQALIHRLGVCTLTQTHADTDYTSDYDVISFLEFNCSKTVTGGGLHYEMCAVGCYAVLHNDT